MAIPWPEQEKLALNCCPMNGFVCMKLMGTGDSFHWCVQKVMILRQSALNWFDDQSRGARVYQIKRGEVTIYSAK